MVVSTGSGSGDHATMLSVTNTPVGITVAVAVAVYPRGHDILTRRARPATPRLRLPPRARSANSGGVSSCIRFAGWLRTLFSASKMYADGSIPCRTHEPIRVYSEAAAWPPTSVRANSQFFRPTTGCLSPR
jgi:hypothetical protein